MSSAHIRMGRWWYLLYRFIYIYICFAAFEGVQGSVLFLFCAKQH